MYKFMVEFALCIRHIVLGSNSYALKYSRKYTICTLCKLRYCNEILDQFMRPYAGAIDPEFILMDNNARPHLAHITIAYLEHETIVRMDRSACSSDLNPIEHAWDILQRAISARPV